MYSLTEAQALHSDAEAIQELDAYALHLVSVAGNRLPSWLTASRHGHLEHLLADGYITKTGHGYVTTEKGQRLVEAQRKFLSTAARRVCTLRTCEEVLPTA